MRVDIRTKIFVLFVASVSIFLANTIWFEVIVVVSIALLQILCGRGVFSKSVFSLYLIFVLTQCFIIPLLPNSLSMIISIPVVQFRKMFPMLMALILIIRTTKVNELIATMTKIGAPKSATITIAVTLRYFPTIAEESGYIHDAMLIRPVTSNNINPLKKLIKKFECYAVPLIISASKTADELTAAAITRGIDNPKPGTCRGYRPLSIPDYILMAISLLYVIASIAIKIGVL